MTLLDEVRDRAQPPDPRYARAVRLAHGVSQGRLAAELGVHRVTLNRWEQGTRRPTGDVARRYSELVAQLASVSVR